MLCQMAMLPSLNAPEAMDAWNAQLHRLMSLPAAGVEPGEDDDPTRHPFWKLKKWIGQVAMLLLHSAKDAMHACSLTRMLSGTRCSQLGSTRCSQRVCVRRLSTCSAAMVSPAM